jgi:hypothetical protein
MNETEQNLVNWGESLLENIPVAGLLSRNPIAYKWKALFRVWMIRELAFWREHDLMVQSYALHQQAHGLGARILLRSGLETLATLTYLNILMQRVIEGDHNFHAFCETTSALLLGARNNDAMPDAKSILTVLDKCEIRYPGLKKLYADLSESAHPNYEGMMNGYSKTDFQEHVTSFSNRWMTLHGNTHLDKMKLCMETFHYEYNDIWPSLITKLETWIEENDAQLEATKNEKTKPPQ